MSRKTRLAKRHIKTLESELRMLQHLRTDLDLTLDEYSEEFRSDMKRLTSLLKLQKVKDEKPPEANATIDDPDTLKLDPNVKEQRWRKTEDGWEREDIPEDLPEETIESSSKKLTAPDWAKKLYKKIALASHPDRTLNDHRHEKLKKIFQDSASAMESGKFKTLLGYALELDIPTSAIGPEVLPLLKQRLESLKQEIETVKQSWEWVWGESMGIIELRSQIAHAYLTSKKIDVKIEDLPDIISLIEGEYEDRETS